MVKEKTNLEIAAGKLISSIQKEWNEEALDCRPSAENSFEVINKGHDLLKGAKNKNIEEILNGLSVSQFLGESWVNEHQTVKQSILHFEEAINESKSV